MIVAVAIWGGSILWDTYVTQKLVTFEPSAGSTIVFGTQDNDNLVIKNEIVKTKTKLAKRLQPGNYVAVFSEDGCITKSQPITIDSSTTIKTPVLSYTGKKLAEILNQEKSTINTVVLSTVKNGVDDNSYTITDEFLYGQADWYFANVTPKPPNDEGFVDLKVILKKSGDTWKAAVKPDTILWIDDYPNIPPDIIRAANKLGFY